MADKGTASEVLNKLPLERAKAIVFGEVSGDAHEPTIINQLLVAIIVIALIMILSGLLKLIYNTVMAGKYDTPWIIEDTHDSTEPRRFLQDPNSDDSVPLRRSLNEQQGLEFTYATWIFVNDFKSGQWKHIFHKGSPTSYPNRAPGVWLHPSTNSMRIYMNTYNSISNNYICLLYTSPSPRDGLLSRMPSSA